MPRVVWTPSALRDVARLHDFLVRKNRAAARRAVRAIRQDMKALATHPEIGRPIEEMAPEFREWLIPFGDGFYVALYRFDGDLVAILAVRHGKDAGY